MQHDQLQTLATLIVFHLIKKCFAESCISDLWLYQLFPSTYRSTIPPISDKKLEVSCIVEPRVMIKISVLNMDMSIESGFTVIWQDNRLKLNTTSREILQKQFVSSFEIPEEIVKKIWIPQIKIANCKRCDPTLLNDFRVFQIRPNFYNSTIVAHFWRTYDLICTFDLRFYPFDTQYCSMDITLPYYQQSNIRLVISKSNLHEKLDIPPDVQLLSQYSQMCSTNTVQLQCVQYVFQLRRQVFSFILLTYIPSGFIVVVSWLSFWISPDNPPSRVTLGLTSLLTLATQFSNIQKDLPSITYLKAIDVWMFACMFSAFASLVEFVIANFSFRKPSSPRRYVMPRPLRYQQKTKLQRTNYKTICNKFKPDYASRLLFPLSFFIFNFIYWPYYINKYYAMYETLPSFKNIHFTYGQ